MIDVPPDQTFPPTVIQSVDACQTPLPFPVSNVGACNLEITDLAITTAAKTCTFSGDPCDTDGDCPIGEVCGEYSLSGLPSFPIILAPGHVAGDGDLNTVFAPSVLERERLGEVSVTYVSEPFLNETTTVSRAMCGEGVRTGARILVTHGGLPLDEVFKIRLRRLVGNTNGNRLDTVDNVMNVPLTPVTPDSPCAQFQYHREYGTVSNPIQLATGSYQVTVQTRINGRMKRKTVGFDVSSCDFNPTIVVDF